MPNKDFLEIYPLYKKFFTNKPNTLTLDDIPKPAINMFCKECDSNQTYNMTNNYYELSPYKNSNASDAVVRARYLCFSCQKEEIVFLLKFGQYRNEQGLANLFIEKVGQYPPWSIKIDKRMNKLLGVYEEYFRRGLVCESQSYGIGAYAYYRRITEEIIEELLNSIAELMPTQELEKYKTALREVHKTKRTEDKIDLVKDLLPTSLIRGGFNPLKELHSSLSIGLHGKSDEDFMNEAEALRTCIEYLVNQILIAKDENKAFTDSMKKILDKRTKS